MAERELWQRHTDCRGQLGGIMAEVASGITIINNNAVPTHFESLGEGGYRSVDDNAARDAIADTRRNEGMQVFVRSTGVTYRKALPLSSNGATWEPVPSGLDFWSEDGTGNLTPDTSAAQNIGSDSNRVLQTTSNRGLIISGGSSPSFGSGAAQVVARFLGGGGTENISAAGGYYGYGAPALVAASASAGAGSTSEVLAFTNAVILGSTDSSYGGTARIRAGNEYGYYASAGMSLAGGNARSTAAGSNARIESINGSIAFGYALAQYGGSATIESNGNGSVATGSARGTTGLSIIRASGSGSSVAGDVSASGQMIASGNGSRINGQVQNGGVMLNSGAGSNLVGHVNGAGSSMNSVGSAGNIHGRAINGGVISNDIASVGSTLSGVADGAGSLINCTAIAGRAHGETSAAGVIEALASSADARGRAINGGRVTASGIASTAIGTADGAFARVTSTGEGSLAIAAVAGVEICTVSGRNAQQIGIGTNTIADSMRLGVGIRIHHLDAVPPVLADGDIFRSGTNVSIRSSGGSVTFDRPTITGSRAGNAALTSLLSLLNTSGLIIDNTTA